MACKAVSNFIVKTTYLERQKTDPDVSKLGSKSATNQSKFYITMFSHFVNESIAHWKGVRALLR